MAFIDEVTIYAAAGKGGDGVVRWLHHKGKEKAGPSGGDGGKGGDVIIEGVHDLAALAHYRYEKKFRAKDGAPGENDLRHGADGDSIVLRVPVGTIAKIVDTGQEFEVTREGEQFVILKGGFGGKGNARFKSSTNQNPFQFTPGTPGEVGDIVLNLKLIADAGLIGLPSAGKSSLLNAITRAHSKVGPYPFTTLEPNLGDFYGRVIADIPGLIEGASAGRGLGTKFLKHVERTRILLHLVSADQDDVVASYKKVRKEIESFGRGLDQKPEIIVLSKIDLVTPEERFLKASSLADSTGREVLSVSVSDPVSVKTFSDRLSKILYS